MVHSLWHVSATGNEQRATSNWRRVINFWLSSLFSFAYIFKMSPYLVSLALPNIWSCRLLRTSIVLLYICCATAQPVPLQVVWPSLSFYLSSYNYLFSLLSLIFSIAVTRSCHRSQNFAHIFVLFSLLSTSRRQLYRLHIRTAIDPHCGYTRLVAKSN